MTSPHGWACFHGDELDAYVIGKAFQGEEVEALPICLVYCIDNGQIDNKLICATTKAHYIKWKLYQIIYFINKYKKGSKALRVTWNPENIAYELAKCKAYAKLFREA